MRTKYRHKFHRFAFLNRWKERYPNGDWVIFGFAKWWCFWDSYCYKICLFGLDFQFWFKREEIPTKTEQI